MRSKFRLAQKVHSILTSHGGRASIATITMLPSATGPHAAAFAVESALEFGVGDFLTRAHAVMEDEGSAQDLRRQLQARKG